MRILSISGQMAATIFERLNVRFDVFSVASVSSQVIKGVCINADVIVNRLPGNPRRSQIVEYVRRLESRVSELEKQETVNCPESVLNALQVLQVCQGLEVNDIGDKEKALVRQMCNVVWKKLEDGPKIL